MRELTLDAFGCSEEVEEARHGQSCAGTTAMATESVRCRRRREAGERFAPSGVDSFGSGVADNEADLPDCSEAHGATQDGGDAGVKLR